MVVAREGGTGLTGNIGESGGQTTRQIQPYLVRDMEGQDDARAPRYVKSTRRYLNAAIPGRRAGWCVAEQSSIRCCRFGEIETH